MGPNAFNRFKFSGDYYKFVIKEKGSDVEVEFYFAKKIFLTADLDDRANLTLRFGEPVEVGSLIANIRDANGNLLMDETVWQTQSLSPVVNVFGQVEFYRCRAIEFQGEL